MMGFGVRDSITRNVPSSAAATPSRPTVRTVSQPASLPLTMANTASMRAAVTVTAPATSSRCRPDPAPDGRMRRAISRTMAPTGMFTRKTQCQLSRSVRTPPTSTPMLPPPAATKPKTPIARARSAPSSNRVMISDSATAETTAPATPCTARAATSSAWVVASPQASDATVNAATPHRNSRRWPYRSPRRPPSSRNPPKVSR